MNKSRGGHTFMNTSRGGNTFKIRAEVGKHI